MLDYKQLKVGDKWIADDGTEYTVTAVTTNDADEILAVESVGSPPFDPKA